MTRFQTQSRCDPSGPSDSFTTSQLATWPFQWVMTVRMCVRMTSSSDARVQVLCKTHDGVHSSPHQIRLWPWMRFPFCSAQETIWSAGPNEKLPRAGCSSSIFIADSAVKTSYRSSAVR